MRIKKTYRLSLLLTIILHFHIQTCYSPKKSFPIYLDAKDIHQAVAFENLPKIKMLITNDKSNLEEITIDKETPLHIAARTGNKEITLHLLIQGANKEARNKFNETPLHLATKFNQKNIVSLLIKNGANMEAKDNRRNVPLHIAMMSDNLEMISFFIENGANLETKNIDGNTPLINLHLKNYSIEKNNLLLTHKADMWAKNKYGEMAVHTASLTGRADILKALLQNIKTTRLKIKYLETKNTIGQTPLHVAIMYDKEKVVKLLIKEGANIETEVGMESDKTILNVHVTPLMLACICRRKNIIKILLKHGANIESKDHTGNTTLHIASEHGFPSICEMLIEHGANIEAKNDEEEPPLHFALSSFNSISVFTFLLERGANIEEKINKTLAVIAKKQRSSESNEILLLGSLTELMRYYQKTEHLFLCINKLLENYEKNIKYSKNGTANATRLEYIKKLIFSKKIPASAKTLASNLLWEIFSRKENFKLFKQMTFNSVLLTDPKYKNLIKYAVFHNLKDVNSRSILDAAFILNIPKIICIVFAYDEALYTGNITTCKTWLNILMSPQKSKKEKNNETSNPIIKKLQLAKKSNRKCFYKNLFKSCILLYTLNKIPNMPPEILAQILGFYYEN